jgi:hypothetical protein
MRLSFNGARNKSRTVCSPAIAAHQTAFIRHERRLDRVCRIFRRQLDLREALQIQPRPSYTRVRMGIWSDDLFKHNVSFVRRTFPDLRNTRHKILESIILNAAARNHLTGEICSST